jgi:CRP/FNR family transcriptional regulator, cyclic AMP receptor protein
MDGPDMELASKETAAALRYLATAGWMSEQPAAFQGRMAQIGRWMSMRRGQVIYTAGDEADAIYGLGEGLLDISILVDPQRDVVIHRATAGFWIGDSALLAGSRRTLTLSAASDGQLFKLPAASVLRDLKEHPEDWICFYGLNHLNVSRALAALAEVISLPPRARFARALLRLTSSAGAVHVTQDELGRMVGMSRATFRRSFAALISKGIVEVEYGRILIHNLPALEIEAARTEE